MAQNTLTIVVKVVEFHPQSRPMVTRWWLETTVNGVQYADQMELTTAEDLGDHIKALVMAVDKDDPLVLRS